MKFQIAILNLAVQHPVHEMGLGTQGWAGFVQFEALGGAFETTCER
jgi:hypothetical protein